jgi:ADP-heptose:LPS heptosyltransferase
METTVRFDCRFYLGDRPCEWGGACEGCTHYSPMGTRILVVKLAAAGDVLRTTAILPPLKRKHPVSHITWVTDPNAVPFLERNPYVDRVMPFGFSSFVELSSQKFDEVLCLDKEPRAAAFAAAVDAERRRGYAITEWGTIRPFDEPARYDFELGLSNERKFHENERSAPDISCEVAGVEYAGEPYLLVLPDESLEYARRFLGGMNVTEPLVGLNVGAGGVFANKAWTPEGYAELARRVAAELGGTSLVLGGADDRDRMTRVLALAGDAAVDGGTHDLMDFAAIVAHADLLVTGDTMALHIAAAVGVPVVALFGPSAPQEIELYDRGRKIVSPVACAPCYRRRCDVTPTCMDEITVGSVFAAVRDVLAEGN